MVAPNRKPQRCPMECTMEALLRNPPGNCCCSRRWWGSWRKGATEFLFSLRWDASELLWLKLNLPACHPYLFLLFSADDKDVRSAGGLPRKRGLQVREDRWRNHWRDETRSYWSFQRSDSLYRKHTCFSWIKSDVFSEFVQTAFIGSIFVPQLLVLNSLPSSCRRGPEVWASIWPQQTPSSSTTRTGILTTTSRYNTVIHFHMKSFIKPVVFVVICRFFCFFPLCPGLQQSSSYRSEQESDDLPLCHQSFSRGEDYSGKENKAVKSKLSDQGWSYSLN